MEIDRITLIEPGGDVRLSLSGVTVRSVTPSNESLVFEAPRDSFDGTPIDGRASDGAGYGIIATTTDGVTYNGYVEVVANGDDTRFCWCGIDF